MHELVLVRGLPGSGKSTYAEEKYPFHTCFEADMWHVDKDGKYKFEVDEISRAHSWVQRNTEYNLRKEKNVVVSNTTISLSQVAVYLEIARRTKSVLTVIDLKTDYGNIHGVPEEVMEKMRENWQDWPFEEIVNTPHWPIYICKICGEYKTLCDEDFDDEVLCICGNNLI